MAKIHRREGINPEEGIHKYGDVTFADPVNNKYPINTAEHVRAAWSYIHHKNDADKYEPDEVALIEKRIEEAAKKFGVHLTE
ncbi:MAG: hypothetical protein IT337_00610 [Thermomicrobiales bacterium]|nr:hypothetical protein [Thermomicrobiales bacterium]